MTARRTGKATRASRATALVAAGLMTLVIGPTASADHHNDHHTVIPSQDDVDAAQQHVVEAQSSVAEIQAELAAANAQLESLSVAAEQAAEAYNGAVVEWQNARADAKAARQRADRAATQSSQARDLLAGYVLSQSNAPSRAADRHRRHLDLERLARPAARALRRRHLGPRPRRAVPVVVGRQRVGEGLPAGGGRRLGEGRRRQAGRSRRQAGGAGSRRSSAVGGRQHRRAARGARSGAREGAAHLGCPGGAAPSRA